MGFSAISPPPVVEVREVNGVEETNALLKEGWEVLTAFMMEGPSLPGRSGHHYVRYVVGRRASGQP